MMKKYIKYMASLLAVSFAMSACIDLEEMNVDPNNATTTNPSLLLTGVAYSAFNQTSSDACHAAKMLILTSGESKYQVYKWTRGDFDYYSNLRDVTKMSEEAGEGSAYQALAHFFRANYFYQLTLDFGSIPYTDALKAETDANYQPAYDSQEVVLAGILKELEEADKMLEGSDEIISGDIIYNGNLVNWRKLINAYRLRILMSLSGKEKVGDIDVKSEFSKIVADGPLMESLSDNGQLIYLDQQDNRYPYLMTAISVRGVLWIPLILLHWLHGRIRVYLLLPRKLRMLKKPEKRLMISALMTGVIRLFLIVWLMIRRWLETVPSLLPVITRLRPMSLWSC